MEKVCSRKSTHYVLGTSQTTERILAGVEEDGLLAEDVSGFYEVAI